LKSSGKQVDSQSIWFASTQTLTPGPKVDRYLPLHICRPMRRCPIINARAGVLFFHVIMSCPLVGRRRVRPRHVCSEFPLRVRTLLLCCPLGTCPNVSALVPHRQSSTSLFSSACRAEFLEYRGLWPPGPIQGSRQIQRGTLAQNFKRLWKASLSSYRIWGPLGQIWFVGGTM
jgi:hypothetical protein